MRGAINLNPRNAAFVSFLWKGKFVSIKGIYVWVWAQRRLPPFKHIHEFSVHDTVLKVWISVFQAIIIIIIDYLTIFDLSQDLLTMLNRLMQSLFTIVKFVVPALLYTEKRLVKVDH